MGLFGSAKKVKLPPTPQLSEMGRWAEDISYSAAERAMMGGGLLPFDTTMERLSALDSAYKEAGGDMSGFLSRFVPKADAQVRDYAQSAFRNSYYSTREGIKREKQFQDYQDTETGTDLALGYLASAKKMGLNYGDVWNQGANQMLQNQMAYGTFTSNLAGGIGGAAGSYMAAQNYGKSFSGTP